MNILSIETSSSFCSVAYISRGIFKSELLEDLPRTASENLPDLVTKLRIDSEFSWNDLDGIAVSIGPGSFTGLRIGLSFAKGLAFSRDLPIIPVPTLSGMAMSVNCNEDIFRVSLFSHRDIFFTQKFTISNNNLGTLDDPIMINGKDLCLITKKEKISSFLYGGNHVVEEIKKIIISAVKPSAKWVGLFAKENWKKLIIKNPSKLIPHYIAPFELSKKKNEIS